MERFSPARLDDLVPIAERPQAQRLLEIRQGNDALRQSLFVTELVNARVVVTNGVQDQNQPLKIIHAIKAFSAFPAGDDPYRQHDFGAVTVDGTRYFFKIDYYDAQYQYGVDPFEEEPHRVLTIMRADEY